jgi:alpha-L-fucosidase
MNGSWGYNPSDTGYKSEGALTHMLSEIAGKGGRLLLNVSPRGDGRLPPEQVERLGAVGEWLARNGAGVFGTQPALEPWQFYGPVTGKADTVYLHLLMRPYETVTVRGVPIRRVLAVRELASGRALEFTTRCAVLDQLLNSDPMGELTIAVPEELIDPLATVIAVEMRSA